MHYIHPPGDCKGIPAPKVVAALEEHGAALRGNPLFGACARFPFKTVLEHLGTE